MRLATAKDEIVPLRDYRVQNNRAYLVIVLLSRVITKLGELSMVDTEVIENLFSTDLAHLQEFYRRINEEGRRGFMPSAQAASMSSTSTCSGR